MMKRFIIASCVVVFLLGGLLYLTLFRGVYWDSRPDEAVEAVFRTQGREIQYQTDSGAWEELVIQGVDVSSNLPGRAALDFYPEYEDYMRWLTQIGEMGGNTVRVYTIMDAEFYEALYDYNTEHSQPLYLLQGLSVPDHANYGAEDIYQAEFVDLLKENGIKSVDVIHGKRVIELGNHTGTGWYRWDVSPWTIGYLLGHEWDSGIIAYTNYSTQGPQSYQGTYFQTAPEATRFETAMAQLMDNITDYESKKYKQQRLISFINSPWDDPFEYETLYNTRFFSYNQLDMEHILPTSELKSGYFAAYRLQYLCPDFQTYLTQAQRTALGDLLTGLEDMDLYSSYLELLSRYHTMPVAAVGFGFSTSRAPVVEGQEPLNEQEQGQALVEMWQKIRQADWAGGFVSTWQDVWDRNTWNTVYATYDYGVDYWQDVQTDGQNYGLMEFLPGEEGFACCVDGSTSEWNQEDVVWTEKGRTLSMKYDARYLYCYVDGVSQKDETIYIPIDTTPNTGSTYCERYDISFERPCDFLIIIDGEHNSRVEVQERYESLWAMYAYETNQENPYVRADLRAKDSPVFRSIRLLVQRKEPQTLANWVAMPTYETGKLTCGSGDPEAPDYNSLTDFAFTDNGVEIRIPWQMLNFSNPAEGMIHDDYYEHYGVEYIHIDELYAGVICSSDAEERGRMSPFALEGWDKDIAYQERLKKSYYVLQEEWAS